MTTPTPPHDMTEQQYKERLDGLITAPLKCHFHMNPVVQDIAKRYAAGEIITKEEALYQIIVNLCEVIERLQDPTTYAKS